MYKITSGTTHNLGDAAAFLKMLENLPAEYADLFDGENGIIVTRAPGRLDLMGGIADYSGSLVLQLPIAAASHVALQRRQDRAVRIISMAVGPRQPVRSFEISLDDFLDRELPIEYLEARNRFAADSQHNWAAYAAGAFPVLMREKDFCFDNGANILIRSEVPEGKGVSSSAALEVSVMQAINAAYRLNIEPRQLGFLCQKVENLIAGAPCGVMDQMTSACGEADQLLALLCQPGELLGTVKLPDELSVWGIDSGIRHAVSGADYGTVRTAAFMGYRMIADFFGLPVRQTRQIGVVEIEDNRWRGYLANLSTSDFDLMFGKRLPQQISGAEFLNLYSGITDTVTTVKNGQTYPVFVATRHPIYEHARVKRFAEILNNWGKLPIRANAVLLGELMYESHDSYSACGLGSEGTDEIVRLVREAGPDSGLYGAKITGGGSGGTVAVLGHCSASAIVDEIAAKYEKLSGLRPVVISGSSPGAGSFGHLKLNMENRQ